MAEIPFLLGVAFEAQTTFGTAATMPDIGAGSGTGGAIENLTDGAVLGDPSTGVGESGISFSIGREFTEKARNGTSFTRNFGNYIGRKLTSFQFALPLKGNGETTTATPVGLDFDPDIGIIALWRAAGLDGNVSGVEYAFTPLAVNYITASIYFGNVSNNGTRLVIRDIYATGVTISLTPGQHAVAVFDFVGTVDSFSEAGSWPTTPIEYGNQATLSAPPVEGAAFTWGPNTPAARVIGFSELSIDVTNEIETIAAANFTPAESHRQIGRETRISGLIDATGNEVLYELNQVGEADTIGTPATGSDVANAWKYLVSDPSLISLEAGKIGGSQAWQIELLARSAGSNTEAALTYL